MSFKLMQFGYQYPEPETETDDDDDEVKENSAIAVLSLNRDKTLATCLLEANELNSFAVKPLTQFISENRYRHVSHFFRAESSLATRYENAYHMVMGKDFDSQYQGLPAFGLLDVSLVTVAASYLWRSVALNDNIPVAFKIGAGIIAAPILLTKFIIGLVAMLTLSLPILIYHGIAKCFDKQDDAPAQNQPDPGTSLVDDDVEDTPLLLK